MRAIVLLLLVGCSADDIVHTEPGAPSPPPVAVDDTWDSSGGAYLPGASVSGRLAGTVGEFSGFSRAFSNARIVDHGYTIELELHVEDGQWAMLAGGFDTEFLDANGEGVLEEGQHYLYACSGPSELDVLYDGAAGVVEVSRVEGPNAEVHLTVWAGFANGDEVTADVWVAATER